MKLKKKISTRIDKIKKKYKKKIANIRWETRYKNLEEKYNVLLEENTTLKKKLDKDSNIQTIWYLRKYIRDLRRQRDNLRREVKK